MKITYCNGWNKESINAWLAERMNGNKQTYQNPNGYIVKFADGNSWEVVYGDWHFKTPTNCYINGEIAQSTLD